MKNKIKYIFIILNISLYGYIFMTFLLNGREFSYNAKVLLAIALIMTIFSLFVFSKKRKLDIN